MVPPLPQLCICSLVFIWELMSCLHYPFFLIVFTGWFTSQNQDYTVSLVKLSRVQWTTDSNCSCCLALLISAVRDVHCTVCTIVDLKCDLVFSNLDMDLHDWLHAIACLPKDSAKNWQMYHRHSFIHCNVVKRRTQNLALRKEKLSKLP